MYTVLRRLFSYIKGFSDGIIDKDMFMQLRQIFPKEYIGACKFYNSNTTSDIINSIQSILDHNYKLLLSTASTVGNTTNTLQSQYQSLSKIIETSLDSVGSSTIFNLINTVRDADALGLRKKYLKTVIKSLVILSIVDHMEHVFKTTILREDMSYNIVTDWKTSQLTTLVEHIDDIGVLSNAMLISEAPDFDDDEHDNDLFDDEDNSITPESLEETVTEDLQRIFFIIVHKLLNIVEKMASTDSNKYQSLLPNMAYIAFYTIIIGMLVSNSF